jgi:hypothetical protein
MDIDQEINPGQTSNTLEDFSNFSSFYSANPLKDKTKLLSLSLSSSKSAHRRITSNGENGTVVLPKILSSLDVFEQKTKEDALWLLGYSQGLKDGYQNCTYTREQNFARLDSKTPLDIEEEYHNVFECGHIFGYTLGTTLYDIVKF